MTSYCKCPNKVIPTEIREKLHAQEASNNEELKKLQANFCG